MTMASSDTSTEPRVGAIAQVAVVAIVTLLLTRAGLISYFDSMERAEAYRKSGSLPTTALDSLRTDEKQRLTTGAMPIDKAMQALASKGRTGAGPDIMPVASASKDLAPLQGWVRMPAAVPPAMSAVPPPPPPAPEPLATDAGAPAPIRNASDAGAAPPPRHP
jgi:hypothetical protein